MIPTYLEFDVGPLEDLLSSSSVAGLMAAVRWGLSVHVADIPDFKFCLLGRNGTAEMLGQLLVTARKRKKRIIKQNARGWTFESWHTPIPHAM